MKKIFSIFVLVLLLVAEVFGQAAVDIQLAITENNNPPTFDLAVGLDLTATNCIDSLLGEYDLQNVPFPPPGVFEIRFNLNLYGCPGVATYKDYRAPGNPPTFPFNGTIEHTLIWQRSQTGTSINIEYNIPTSAQMRIRDQINGTLLNIGPFAGSGVAVIPGTYPLISAYLYMDYMDIVPVELTSFTVTVLQNEKAVRLNWITATETNNSVFEIQRNVFSPLPGGERKGWVGIGFVPGFGTTTEPKSYSFIDENVTTGNYKYRLKQIDFDGSFEYSNEIEVEVDFTPKEFVLYQNYPNPFNPTTTIKYEIPASLNPSKGGTSRNVSLKVYDLLGNEVAVLINQEQEPGVYEILFNADHLSAGVYFYQLKADGFINTKKLILLK